jgi:aspartate 1-decarboxylase
VRVEEQGMQITMLKSKIHRATVTGADLTYEGSIAISPMLLDAARLRPFEQVDIYNCNNGARFSTYVICGKAGEVCLNGAAARLAMPDDLVIIASYAHLDPAEADTHKPVVVFVDEHNRPKK